MERRTASHTEEEELNQRRRLLNLARKGDPKAINRLFELYQVRIYSGEVLSKAKRVALATSVHEKPKSPSTKVASRNRRPTSRQTAGKSARKVAHR